AGAFGRALDASSGGVSTQTVDRSLSETPITVEARVKINSADRFNVIVSHEDKSSGEHWELYTFQGSGALSAFLPGYEPAALESSVNVADGKWHHVAMSFDGRHVRLYVEGKQVAAAQVKRNDMPRVAGPIMVGYAQQGATRIGCDGLIAGVRISRGVRKFKSPVGAMKVDDQTLALWDFNRRNARGQFLDASPRGLPIGAPIQEEQEEQEDHFEGFRETDVRDDRWQAMDTGPTFTSSLGTPYGATMKAIAVQLGDDERAALAFDTETLRVSAAWDGAFIRTDPMRFGLIGQPRVAGDIKWAVREGTGWAHNGRFTDPRLHGLGPIPDDHGRFEGHYMHGERIVFAYTVGEARVLDSPWIEEAGPLTAWTRTFEMHDARSA
ncbi:MAG: LamG domain-containing protein, partial [Phycisphaeraceae bacterium]